MTQALNHRRILVVDDNEAIHNDFRKILVTSDPASSELDKTETALFGETTDKVERPQFEVESAFQGREALQKVEQALAAGKPYAMAFVDVRMPPGWDGVETVSRIWQVDPEIQIVICTAYSEYSWDRMLEKLGQSDRLLILKKPFDNIEVFQLANSLTEKWMLLQKTKTQLTTLEQKVEERTRQLGKTNCRLEAEVEERKQTEEALRKSQETVLRQERLAVVGQLSAGLAHEFNNILTVIQGYTNILLGTAQDAETRDATIQIRGSVDRAAKLTRHMLAFSRKQVIQPQMLDPNILLDQTKTMLQSIMRSNVEVAFEPGSGVKINADPGMMEQILFNLAVNARDAMPNGGRLSISTHDVEITETHIAQIAAGNKSGLVESSEACVGRFMCLRFTDTGCGMSEQTLHRIFEPFFTTKEVGKGTGLGLSSVHGIVKQHGGWVEVNTQLGKGTTFRIFLPAAQHEVSSIEQLRVVAVNDRCKTILFAEDEQHLRKLVKTVLQRQGYKVLEAASGVEALRLWQQNSSKVDLLLTDIVMPEGVSGIDLADKLLAEQPSLPVIYTSGYSEELLDDDRLEQGVNFLAKPYDLHQIVETVHAAIGLSSEVVEQAIA